MQWITQNAQASRENKKINKNLTLSSLSRAGFGTSFICSASTAINGGRGRHPLHRLLPRVHRLQWHFLRHFSNPTPLLLLLRSSAARPRPRLQRARSRLRQREEEARPTSEVRFRWGDWRQEASGGFRLFFPSFLLHRLTCLSSFQETAVRFVRWDFKTLTLLLYAYLLIYSPCINWKCALVQVKFFCEVESHFCLVTVFVDLFRGCVCDQAICFYCDFIFCGKWKPKNFIFPQLLYPYL